MALKVCNDRRCTELTDQPHCPAHTKDPRPSAAARGYDHSWQRKAQRFLAQHTRCIDCGAKATHADHSPASRRQLIAMGVADPDDSQHLEPRCESCHNSKTARTGS